MLDIINYVREVLGTGFLLKCMATFQPLNPHCTNPGRFGPIPVRSGRFGPGRFGPISGVSRFGPVGAGRFGPIS